MNIFIKKQDGTFYDVTPIFEKVSITSSISQFKKIANLSVIDNKTSPLLPLNPIEITSEIKITENGVELFRGIVVIEDERKRNQKIYTAYDYAWYYEKNKESFYFEDVLYSTAIRQVMDFFGMELKIFTSGEGVTITKLFKTSSIADILNWIFREYRDKTGKEIEMRVEGTTFNLLETKRQDYIDGRYQPKSFIVDLFDQTLDFTDLISTKNQTKSFENLKNSIKVNSFDKTSFQTEAEVVDSVSINKYGLLQEVIEFNYDVDEFPETMARNNLKLLNKESNSLDIEVSKGSPSITSGEIISISDSILEIDGVFEVSKVILNWENSNLSMRMSLDEIL